MLCEAITTGKIKPDDTLVMVAFGAGLTWGAMTIKWGVTPPPEPTPINRLRREAIFILAYWRSRLSRTLRQVTSLLYRSPLRGIYRRIDPVDENGQDKKGPPR